MMMMTWQQFNLLTTYCDQRLSQSSFHNSTISINWFKTRLWWQRLNFTICNQHLLQFIRKQQYQRWWWWMNLLTSYDHSHS
jgi:hypothetical protein